MVGQAFSPVLLELMRNALGTEQFMLDGQPVLMDVNANNKDHGSLVMLTPRQLVTGRVAQLTLATGVLLVLCLLGVLALTWRYAQTVVAPIRAVSMKLANWWRASIATCWHSMRRANLRVSYWLQKWHAAKRKTCC